MPPPVIVGFATSWRPRRETAKLAVSTQLDRDLASSSDTRQRHLKKFCQLAQERINRLNIAWIQFEQGIESDANVSEMLGTLHTLKGEAGLMGLDAIADVAHALEDLVQVIAHSDSPPQQIGELILNGLDVLTDIVTDIDTLSNPSFVKSAKDFVAEAARTSAVITATRLTAKPLLAPARPLPPPTEKPATKPLEPGPKAQQQARQQATSAIPAVVIPAETGPQQQKRNNRHTIPRPPMPTLGEEDLSGPQVAPNTRGIYEVRVRPAQLDRMRDIIGDLLLARTRLTSSADGLRTARTRQDDGLLVTAEQPDNALEDTLRVIESQLRDDVLRISSLVSQLDEITRTLRMVSISVLFERYPGAVRRISRRLGRQVYVECRGESVEADREVLEAVDAPIIHLTRNAVDHGIEAPEARLAAGKTASGTVTISAEVRGDTLYLDVADDGSGIDVELVRTLAVERNIVDVATARTMSERQVLHCLFAPGMSTRREVGKVSGRGIGLDVVARTVYNLGGELEVSTELGIGTTFHLVIPIRAAITPVLLFRVGAGWYGIQTRDLIELVEVEHVKVIERSNGPVIAYEGKYVPILNLHYVLNESSENQEAPIRSTERLIIARYGSEQVISLSGSHSHLQREGVLESVRPVMHDNTLISAGLALEDGAVALVLNIGAVVKMAKGRDEAAYIPKAQGADVAGDEAPPPLVLVSEDSPFIRDLIVSALRSHDLRVLEAENGVEALEQLEEHRDIELLVTDIEMPAMNGLDLIQSMRKRFDRRIPAIVVSTRGSDEDKLAAVRVGADAYLVKSEFSREGLWALVSRFLG